MMMHIYQTDASPRVVAKTLDQVEAGAARVDVLPPKHIPHPFEDYYQKRVWGAAIVRIAAVEGETLIEIDGTGEADDDGASLERALSVWEAAAQHLRQAGYTVTAPGQASTQGGTGAGRAQTWVGMLARYLREQRGYAPADIRHRVLAAASAAMDDLTDDERDQIRRRVDNALRYKPKY